MAGTRVAALVKKLRMAEIKAADLAMANTANGLMLLRNELCRFKNRNETELVRERGTWLERNLRELEGTFAWEFEQKKRYGKDRYELDGAMALFTYVGITVGGIFIFARLADALVSAGSHQNEGADIMGAAGIVTLACSLLSKVVGKVLGRKLDFEQARSEAKGIVSESVGKARAILEGTENRAEAAAQE